MLEDEQNISKENNQDNRLGILMMISSIVLCFVGVWMLGEIYTQSVRIFVGLSEEKIETIIPQILILMVIAIIGTIILVLAFGLKNKKMRLTIILFSILVPTILEIVDLTIRSVILYNEIMQNPDLLLSLL